jgi:hypothetical protein
VPFVSAMPLEDFIDETAARRATARIADAGGDELQRRTKRHTPVGNPLDPNRRGRPPGTARESIERSDVERLVRAGREGFRVRVLTYDPVFPFIEWTTRPHIIRPRADRAPASVIATRRPRGTVQDGRAALSWLTLGGGRVFAREVHHPGTRGAHPFALAALELEGGTNLRRIAEPAVEQFAREVIRAVA